MNNSSLAWQGLSSIQIGKRQRCWCLPEGAERKTGHNLGSKSSQIGGVISEAFANSQKNPSCP